MDKVTKATTSNIPTQVLDNVIAVYVLLRELHNQENRAPLLCVNALAYQPLFLQMENLIRMQYGMHNLLVALYKYNTIMILYSTRQTTQTRAKIKRRQLNNAMALEK